MRINILLCDTFPGMLPSDIPDYVSLFVNLFRNVPQDIEYKVFMAMDGELPETVDSSGIYLIPGCLCSAYDDIPWIHRLEDWIRNAVSRHGRLLGICFGHQLIAQALGGKVEPDGSGIGIRESQVLDETLKRYFPNGKMHLLYNHYDQVTKAPEGAEILAASPFCAIEGLRFGKSILTFQGHPEFTVDFERHFILNHNPIDFPEVKEAALKSLDQHLPQGDIVAQFIIDFFERGYNKIV